MKQGKTQGRTSSPPTSKPVNERFRFRRVVIEQTSGKSITKRQSWIFLPCQPGMNSRLAVIQGAQLSTKLHRARSGLLSMGPEHMTHGNELLDELLQPTRQGVIRHEPDANTPIRAFARQNSPIRSWSWWQVEAQSGQNLPSLLPSIDWREIRINNDSQSLIARERYGEHLLLEQLIDTTGIVDVGAHQ